MDTITALTPGLDHPVFDSIKVFRAVADAMSHPGEIKHMPAHPPAPAQLMPAAAALCLSLLDFETVLWLQSPRLAVADYLRFHCGCPVTLDPLHASFALITNTAAMPELCAFNAGEPEYPDRSTTLLIQVASLSNASGVRLSGPGLRQPVLLDVAGMSAGYWRQVQESRAAFPCGLDIVFIWGERIAALPRTTVVEYDMYVAVKGGEQAILNSWRLLAEQRRGDASVPELTLMQIREQLGLAVDRVMAEASLYDPELAALAIKQAQGDAIEAVFLLRAYRTTLPRLGASLPIDTAAMTLARRISATFKDVPGGQVLGATYDYTQRLLDFELTAGTPVAPAPVAPRPLPAAPRITEIMGDEGLLASEAPPPDDPDPRDLTREPLGFPADRALRLQNLARGDEGFLLALGYSTQRGYANTHPFAGELRQGIVAVEVVPEELGFAVEIGEIAVTECQMVNQFAGSATELPQFTRGYGLTFGACERKAMAMALVDRSLRAEELGETISSPAQMQEFVLYHSDNVEASGFVQHLKLPHYVDFQSELELVRKLRTRHLGSGGPGEEAA